ncbi:hypothetical protein LZ480_15725 [Solibacillus sp. MA9]|uniref:Uncharacterized protein n=1 Tax=Solibacillus palustris TaxID=2908203 RepID=A0ABS9UGR3_9BACL|nr:hypothetical protein [Solibacillus sp. MA9]MCH7323325.1 hypothetical protein [Solibacillus sp. MA9]
MKPKFLYFILPILSIWLIVGCTNKEAIEKTDNPEQYTQIKQVPWAFVEENEWTNTTKGDWQSATVKNVIATNNYHLFDKTDEGNEALSVTFEDKDGVLISAPSILVDPVMQPVP